MAKSRKDRNGVERIQVTGWITKRAFMVATRRVAARQRSNPLKRTTVSEICASILDEQLK